MRTGLVVTLLVVLLCPALATSDRRAEFDLYVGPEKVGSMTLRAMSAASAVILNQEFRAPYKGKDAGFTAMFVYTKRETPVPARATATTTLGDLKLMEGQAVFSASGDTLTAKIKVTGYADKEKGPLAEPRTEEKEVSVPPGLVLSYPAFLHFAPQLLTNTGNRDGVVSAEIPDDLDFPEFANFKGGCVLERRGIDPDGAFRISLRQTFSGGNARDLMTATYDASGRLVESTMGRFTLRPVGAAAPEPGPVP